MLLGVPLRIALADALWQTLPPTPPPVAGEHAGHAKVNGINLYYATIGQGPPVVLLHGGLANSRLLGESGPGTARDHTVIDRQPRPRPQHARRAALRLRPDGRRCGRAARHLHIAKADVVGWSDGGIIGLDMAMRHSNT